LFLKDVKMSLNGCCSQARKFGLCVFRFEILSSVILSVSATEKSMYGMSLEVNVFLPLTKHILVLTIDSSV